jgi:hypothetical protein
VSGQNQAQDIIDAENARIDAKEQSYQNMQFGKKRVLELNTNFQQRTTAFNWIVVIFFITLAFIIFLLYLDRIVPGIHDYTNIAIYVVLFLGIAYCIYLYAAFIRRDPSDYDKIVYSPDANAVTLSSNAAAANASINGGTNTISTGGNTTQTSAQIPRQVQTYYTNAQGNLVNVYGQRVDANGNLLNSDGTIRAPPVLFQSEPIKLYKNTLGQIVDVNGNPIDPKTGTPTNVCGVNLQIDPKGNVLFINPVTGKPFEKLPTTITIGTPSKEIIVNVDGTLESPKGTLVNIKGEPINPDGTVISSNGTTPGNIYGTTASGIGNYYGTTASGNVNAYGTTISSSSLSGSEYSTTPSANMINNLNTILSGNSSDSTDIKNKIIPTLITGEIFLGDLGRNTISVVDAKTIIFYYLNTSKDIFTSLDGVNFTNKNNPNLIATVVTEGPNSKLANRKITGKGILIYIKGTNIGYYFYPSKFPALLKKNDVFIGPNGDTEIKVETQNRFNLISIYSDNASSKNDLNIISTYTSTDGVYFIDDNGCSLNKAKIVLDGPNNPITNKPILGQAILLYDNDSGENVYFYYNGNTSENESNSNVDSQPNTEFSSADFIKANSQIQTTPSFFFSPPPVSQQLTTFPATTPKSYSPGLQWKAFTGGLSYPSTDYSNILDSEYKNKKFNSFQYLPYYNGGNNTLSSNNSNLLTNISFNNNISSANNIFRFDRPNEGYNNGLIINGFFKPDKDGTWYFKLGIGQNANDDMSCFWIDDNSPVNNTTKHWPPDDTNYNLLTNFQNSNEKIENSIYTTTLKAGVYYPIQISWGQTWGGSVLGFYFGTDKNNLKSDGTGLLFSDTNVGIGTTTSVFSTTPINQQLTSSIGTTPYNSTPPTTTSMMPQTTTFGPTTFPSTTRLPTTLPGTTMPGTTRLPTALPGTTLPATTLPSTTRQATTLPATTQASNTPPLILDYASNKGFDSGITVANGISRNQTGINRSYSVSRDSYFYIPNVPKNTAGYSFSFFMNLNLDTNNYAVFSLRSDKEPINRLLMWKGDVDRDSKIILYSHLSGNYNTNFKPELNKNYHIVWTLDTSNKMSFYVNGSLNYSSTQPNFYQSFDSSTLYLFNDHDGNIGNMVGYLDDFRYYDGILTQTQITNLSNRKSIDGFQSSIQSSSKQTENNCVIS